MTIQKTIGVLSTLVLIAMLIISPTADHAFASHAKTSKTTSETKPISKKPSISDRNLKTEARHKNLKTKD